MTAADEDERWAAHRREHDLIAQAVEIARIADVTAVTVALDDHHREHSVHEQAHDREHDSVSVALSKAENATERRFESVNEFRSQLKDQAASLATREAVETLALTIDRRMNEINKTTADWREAFSKSMADRFDAQGRAIIAIEKGDVKQEGKGIGQGAAIAAIVGAVGFAATLLGLLIVVANLLTK